MTDGVYMTLGGLPDQLVEFNPLGEPVESGTIVFGSSGSQEGTTSISVNPVTGEVTVT